MTTATDLETLLLARVETIDDEKVLTRKTFEEVGLTDDLDMATVKRVESCLSNYRAKATRALGVASLEELVANPNKDKVETRAEYGSQSTIRATVRRSHSVGKGEKRKDYFGHATVVVSNGNEPELLEAIESIANRGKELFGPK